MKKSTIAVATLLAALSAAPIMSVAYADDAVTPAANGDAKKCCQGQNCCKGNPGDNNGSCKGAATCGGKE